MLVIVLLVLFVLVFQKEGGEVVLSGCWGKRVGVVVFGLSKDGSKLRTCTFDGSEVLRHAHR